MRSVDTIEEIEGYKADVLDRIARIKAASKKTNRIGRKLAKDEIWKLNQLIKHYDEMIAKRELAAELEEQGQ